jgi:tripartite-type tricarboxylate transporter receptor subunit TctC
MEARRFLFALFALVLSLNVAAQTFPTKPIRLVVPFPPGGPTDIVGRAAADALAGVLKQPVIVDNRAGAGGNIGADFVAKAPADGYTVLLGTTSTLAINYSLYQNLPFDPRKDFAPIGQIGFVPLILAVNNDLPVRSVSELIALAKKQPGKLNCASAGSGTTQHLACELMNSMTGTKFVHVPYKGSTAAITDLLGGRVEISIETMPLVLPHVKAGKLRALAVASPQRSPTTPDLPTLSESGLPGFDVVSFFGLVAPAGTPRDVLSTLSEALEKGIGNSDVREKLMGLGLEIQTTRPDAFSGFLLREFAKWEGVIRASGAKVN